jgi:fatty acid kinase fatty acid binding subunit
MDIGIVTDSTADIPPELSEEHDIHVVPDLVIMDGKSLEDNKDISREEFYTRLPYLTHPPTTATASTGAYQTLYEKIFRAGASHIISIHPPSHLSGIFNTASTAGREFGERVRVWDSGSLTLGMGFQALAAAEAAARKASLDEVMLILASAYRRVRVIAMLDTLEYVRRSGRVGWARARLGQLLQVKPFVEVRGGKILSLGETRTRSKGISRLLQLLRGLGDLERLAVLHTNAESDARQFLEDLNPTLPTHPLIINVTTVIGTHVGPNGLGFAAVVK